jgi:hypothetical protein
MRSISLDTFIRKGVITLGVAYLLMGLPVLGQSGGPYDLSWSTIDGGGGRSSGGTYVLTGTIGQPDAAYSSGGDYELFGGFWPGGLICIPDIVNFEDFAKFADEWLYTGPHLAADLDGDEDVDFDDLYLFVDEWLFYRCPYNWPLK